jgi:predicted Fe-Mo cluster-binding NifX family protein
MKIVGFPSTSEGLDGQMSAHFGKVSAFTLVHYDETTNKIIDVKNIQNKPHEQGGCMAPVMVLKDSGTDEIVLGGIGMRPLQYFIQLGIKPYRGIAGTVNDNFNALVNGKLKPLFEGTCNHNDQC